MNTLVEINESLKKESVQYYEDYKELKKRFTLERVIIKEEKVTIEEMEKKYRQEKENTEKFLEDNLREKVFFKNKVGIQNSNYIDSEIDQMVDILNTLKFDNDIFSDLSKKEEEILNYVLNRFKLSNKEETLINKFKDTYTNLSEELLIKQIEELTNNLIKNDSIAEIDIKQNSDKEFIINNTYLAEIEIENGVLQIKILKKLEQKRKMTNNERKHTNELKNSLKSGTSLYNTGNLDKNTDILSSDKLISNKSVMKLTIENPEFVNFENWLLKTFPAPTNKVVDKNVSKIQSLQKSMIIKQVEKIRKNSVAKSEKLKML